MSGSFPNLAGRTVLVTDGTSPLAPALAEVFGSAGAEVVIVSPPGAPGRDGPGRVEPADLSRAQGARLLLESLAREGRELEVILVPLSLSGPVELASDAAFLPITLLRASLECLARPPRYLIPLIYEPDAHGTPPARAVARTLLRYAAGHLAGREPRLNSIWAQGPRGPELAARASRAALALSSGWLDAVRGQELVIGDA